MQTLKVTMLQVIFHPSLTNAYAIKFLPI